MKVGGLRLLERAILTLNKAGVEHFRIVVGAYRDQVVPEMQKLNRLKDIDVEYVVCEDFEKGNGVSFGAGAAGFDEPFLLTMSDHIFSPATIQDFIQETTEQPHLPALACDPELHDVFDMDDATKVASKEGFINNIGKEITEYDLVDTGLFYFPKNYGKRVGNLAKNGTNSVSNIIQEFIDESGVRAVSLEKPMWQDVDNPSMKKEAERRLMQQIVRPSDGWVSRKINRYFSTRISFWLARFNVSPNIVTALVFLLTMVGAWFASSGIYQQIAIGALIFQLASIFDGCDGELARLTLRTSRVGAWFEQFASNLRYIIFFEALGISAWHATGSQVYLFAVVMLAALAIYMLAQMGSMAYNQRHEINPTNLIPENEIPANTSSLLDGFFNFWRELHKQDMLAFVTFLFCIVFLYQAMFWLALLGTTATAIMVSKSVTASAMQKEGAGSTIFGKINPIYFYLFGVVILCALIFNMEIGVVAESLAAVGNKLFLVFSVAILWILANTMCLRILVNGKVSFPDLMYNQLTGDAYNTIIPLAGLGGEPHKLKHLTQWLDWHTASQAIVVDRLIHATTGLLFSALCVGVTLYTIELDTVFFVPLTIAASLFMVSAVGMVWLSLSSAPSKIAGFILKKLKIVGEYRNDPVPPKMFVQAFFFKFLGRSFNLVEIYLMFMIFGLAPDIFDLTAVAGFIATSASLFFVIPQGLGVNELGISAALDILGYTAALGITFGLIRRARMIFWALFGVALHLTVSVVKKFTLSSVRG